MEDTCVICGRVIPEGRQVCPACEQKQNETEDNSRKVPAQTKKTENSPRHKKAFKASLFDSLSAFFHIKGKAKNHERNNYLPGEPKRRRDQDHYVRQFRHRAGHGREKGAPG